MLKATRCEDEDGKPHANQFAGHVLGRHPKQYTRAHESVGRNGAEECHFGLEVDLVLGNMGDVAVGRFRHEQVSQIPKEVDCGNASCEVGNENKAPVVQELPDRNSLGNEPDNHVHGVTSEELSSKDHDEPDGSWEEEPDKHLGQHRPRVSNFNGDSSRECNREDNSKTDPPASDTSQEEELQRLDMRFLHRQLFDLFLNFIHCIDVGANLKCSKFPSFVL
mmetsp:Transcript_20686/g.46819  ORF Transcript_20686/g.46819 Transcript_20686/m.46819 type:complete len:221 (-) Transcript_20686:205-867(-)